LFDLNGHGDQEHEPGVGFETTQLLLDTPLAPVLSESLASSPSILEPSVKSTVEWQVETLAASASQMPIKEFPAREE
jgi:hypothetical protein